MSLAVHLSPRDARLFRRHAARSGMTLSAFAAAANPTRYPDISHGFAKDRDNLRGDVKKVTAQFNSEIRKAYGK